MYLSPIGPSPIHTRDTDLKGGPAHGPAQGEHPGPRVDTPPSVDDVRGEGDLAARQAPEGADPALWEMLNPAERAYLSGSFDRLTYGADSGRSSSSFGRGVYVDLRV